MWMKAALRKIMIGTGLLVMVWPLAGEDLGWTNLDRINHSNRYKFILDDGTCRELRIRAVKPDSLVVVLSENDSRVVTGKIARPAVIQVRDDQILYSSRSSWGDVQSIRKLYLHEYIKIALKSGVSIKGEIANSSDSGITLRPAGGSDIPKETVARIDYIRPKPIPEADQYMARETPLVWLDPRLWPYLVNIGVLMDVRLYDAGLPEDNTPLHCTPKRGKPG
jgi:hypothetical protein